jgi:hypothetical protein
MSRLYSSPEVSSLGCLLWVFALGCLPWNVPSLGLRLSWSLGVSSRLGIKSFGYKVALVQSRSGTKSLGSDLGSDPAHASRAPNHSAVRFHTDFAVRRGQQGRAPQQSSADRWLPQIIPPAKTSTGFSRDLSSAISGFRSLCGRKRRSTLKPSRSSRPAFRNLSLGAGSRSENPASTRNTYPCSIYGVARTGPATLDRCCERNVVAPGEYSK